jgi:hypothetical protein
VSFKHATSIDFARPGPSPEGLPEDSFDREPPAKDRRGYHRFELPSKNGVFSWNFMGNSWAAKWDSMGFFIIFHIFSLFFMG